MRLACRLIVLLTRTKIELSFSKVAGNDLIKGLNFNYEFRYKDIDSFWGNLDEIPILLEKFKSILSKLNIQC